MKRIEILFLWAILFLAGCNVGSRKSEGEKANTLTSPIKNITMFSLFANPSQYNGKKIRIQGYLSLGFEATAIYFHKEDHDVGISKNGIWLEFLKSQNENQFAKFNNKYVILEGVFNSEGSGHMKAYSGEIYKITRIDTLR